MKTRAFKVCKHLVSIMEGLFMQLELVHTSKMPIDNALKLPVAHTSNVAARIRPKISSSLVKAAYEDVLIFTCDQTTLPGHY